MTDYELGLNGATIPGEDTITRIDAASAAGFRYYEPRVPDLEDIVSKRRFGDLKRRMDDLKLGWLPLNALEDVIFPDYIEDFQEKRDKLFELAEKFGISTIIVVPANKPEEISDGKVYDQALKELRVIKKKASSSGLDIAFEMIGFDGRAFNTVSSARKLTEELGIPLVIDTFHLAMSEATERELSKLSPDMIEVVHVSDAIVSDSLAKVTDDDRVIPGEGDLPLEKYLRPLLENGCKGPFSVEVFHEKYSRENPKNVAKKSHDSLIDLIERSR